MVAAELGIERRLLSRWVSEQSESVDDADEGRPSYAQLEAENRRLLLPCLAALGRHGLSGDKKSDGQTTSKVTGPPRSMRSCTKSTNLPEHIMAKKLDLPDPQLDDRMQTFIEQGSGTDTKDIKNPLNEVVKESLNKGGETKRLVVDIPASLHRRIKLHCAAEECKMNAFIRDTAVATLERGPE